MSVVVSVVVLAVGLTGIDSRSVSLSRITRPQLDCIVAMLPRSEHVSAVFLGPQGVIANLRRPTLLVDSSSIDPHVAAQVAGAARAAGHWLLDAPVSGGVPAAEAAQLTFMVGGEAQALEAVTPILEVMGRRIFHCGCSGKGQAVKVCNNMIMGVSMLAVAESMRLGEALGLDVAKLSEVVNCSSGRCWASEAYHPVPGVLAASPASRGYAPGFTTRLLLKDLGLASKAAEDTAKTQTKLDEVYPLLSEAIRLYSEMDSAGHGDKDFSFVYRHFGGKREA
eukprot:Selendium_serpulae@DN3874_c0_g1_i2.p1